MGSHMTGGKTGVRRGEVTNPGSYSQSQAGLENHLPPSDSKLMNAGPHLSLHAFIH